MNVSGGLVVNAPRQTVYDTLRNANAFVRFVDGIRDLKEIDSSHYEAVFEVRVAYLRFRFNVTVELTRAESPSILEARIEGTPIGVVGRLTATSLTRLTEDGNDTQIVYEVRSTLTGKLGAIGEPVLRAKAKEMEKIFADRLSSAFDTVSG